MEYTDRITSKSLVFFRCQLKGCRAKGVLNANTKKFIVNQNHALQYVSHIPNKKSNIKILIEKAFAEKSYLKDIQIIFCTYLADTKNKKNINMISDNSNVNNNYNIKESENNDKFKSGENKYEEYLNKIILANRDNERKTNQCLYTVEINLNNNNKNKNNLYYLKENQIFGNRYHKNLSNEIYLYSFDNYDKEEKHILFICGYEGCTGQAFYDLETKQFNITVPHLLCYELHYKSFQQIDSYKKVKKIFDEAPEYTDIQFILKDKTINILK
jgi:hypothetical protein